MKHTLKITLLLVLVFLFSQIIGLLVTNQYIDYDKSIESGNITWEGLPYDFERPEFEEGTSPIWIAIIIGIGTFLLLLLIRYEKVQIWKYWFFFGVWVALVFSFGAFLNQTFAMVLAFLFAYIKIFRPNIWVHNFTELFIYGGLAAIFVPVISIKDAFILLIIISIYDMYAVWKSKHMVKLAKFQTKSNVFAGLLIPYKIPKHEGVKNEVVKKVSKGIKALKNVKNLKIVKDLKSDNDYKMQNIKTAVLGGGDIGFPLIFTGVVMKGLLFTNIFSYGLLKTLIVTLTTTIALLWLLLSAKKDKFYPAMPFISIGCFVGYLILFLFGWI